MILEGPSHGEMTHRAPRVAAETTGGCRLTLKWNKMFGKFVKYLRKFESKEQVCANIMYIQRLQDGLNASVKYIEHNWSEPIYKTESVSYYFLLDILLAMIQQKESSFVSEQLVVRVLG